MSPFVIQIRSDRTSPNPTENRAGYARLTLSFSNKVPEPATFLLLTSGALALLALGRRERH